MRARTLVLLLLAVILAGGTALLARVWLASQRASEVARVVPTAPPRPSKSVLVARADIERGQILKAQDMTWQAWPEGSLDKNYIASDSGKKPESFAGWVAVNPIGGGEPITEARIIEPGKAGFLAAVLRPGMRAISIPVTVTSGISGFIFPGDTVDLLLTYPVPAPPAANGETASKYEHRVTETMMQDVRVIAIDQRLHSKPGEAVIAHTATLEVTPKQVELITVAAEVGKMSLSLRSLAQAPNKATTREANASMAPTNASMAPTNASMATTTNASMAGTDSAMAGTDSSVRATATYTFDSEVSPLLPEVAGKKGAPITTVVTILHGTARTSESKSSEPAPKGL
jgi:pilus assembly protein CpaB